MALATHERPPMVSVSIVSHGHGAMVQRLVASLLRFPEVAQVIVTLNVPEPMDLITDSRIVLVKNSEKKGFGANHNAAFQYCSESCFCVLNPDIELPENPFPSILTPLCKDDIGLVVPRVNSPLGTHEDSWRRFPTVRSLFAKALAVDDGRYPLPVDGKPFSPDWAAGMFMLFRSSVYQNLRGFDEGFFLYYEDVDICVRLQNAGYRLLAVPEAVVVHDARRDSHRKLTHLQWHLLSIVRYFSKHWWRLPSGE